MKPFYLDFLLSRLKKGSIIWLILKFSKLFFKKQAIHIYVLLLLLSLMYDFISEKVTPEISQKTSMKKSRLSQITCATLLQANFRQCGTNVTCIAHNEWRFQNLPCQISLRSRQCLLIHES